MILVSNNSTKECWEVFHSFEFPWIVPYTNIEFGLKGWFYQYQSPRFHRCQRCWRPGERGFEGTNICESTNDRPLHIWISYRIFLSTQQCKSVQPQFKKENPRKYGRLVGLWSYGKSVPTICKLSWWMLALYLLQAFFIVDVSDGLTHKCNKLK